MHIKKKMSEISAKEERLIELAKKIGLDKISDEEIAKTIREMRER